MNSTSKSSIRKELAYDVLFRSPSSNFPSEYLHSISNFSISPQHLNSDRDLMGVFERQQRSGEDDSFSPNIDLAREIYSSYDIYGNDLNPLNSITPFDDENHSHQAVEELTEEILSSEELSDPIETNKENTDPESNTVTPLKRKPTKINDDSTRSSYYSMRSPLVDITPPLVRKKAKNHSKAKIERVLLYTPQQETIKKSQEPISIKSFR